MLTRADIWSIKDFSLLPSNLKAGCTWIKIACWQATRAFHVLGLMRTFCWMTVHTVNCFHRLSECFADKIFNGFWLIINRRCGIHGLLNSNPSENSKMLQAAFFYPQQQRIREKLNQENIWADVLQWQQWQQCWQCWQCDLPILWSRCMVTIVNMWDIRGHKRSCFYWLIVSISQVCMYLYWSIYLYLGHQWNKC